MDISVPRNEESVDELTRIAYQANSRECFDLSIIHSLFCTVRKLSASFNKEHSK